jgi:hypothetical protein
VHLENGENLVIKAPRNSARNVYVQGLTVNGKPWTSTSLPHALLSKGGVLDFDMGPRPSAWGTGKNAAPVSITQDDKVPSPHAGVLKGDGPLFDNTSATEATVTSVDLPVSAPAKAVQYTLTSPADHTKAPTSWTLQASRDGTTWTTLDARSGESFTWDRQTRSFSIPHTGFYTHYRLVLSGESALAEVELLA